jgi:aryl-alcohol dehydrogenase-like predicted oxidoreductase
MDTRQLGTSGLIVSAAGLGCMASYGPRDDEATIRIIRRALDLGVTFFDTAAAYGLGQNERLVGQALKGRRHEIVLATKCGIVESAPGGPLTLDGSPREIQRSCEASLARLGVDSVDLFYLHRVDPQVPIEDSVGAMAELVRQGKVRHLGLSEASPATLRRAVGVHAITALQSEYSLWCRDPEEQILPACRSLGIGFVPFSPLGRGFLSGSLTSAGELAPDDARATLPRFAAENLQQNLKLVRRLEGMAHRRGCRPTELALAWLLAQGPDIVPIPGTRREVHLESNVAAVNLQLSRADLADIDAAFPHGAAVGARYAGEMLGWVDRSA